MLDDRKLNLSSSIDEKYNSATQSSPSNQYLTTHTATMDEMAKPQVSHRSGSNEIEHSYLLTELDTSTNRSVISPNNSGLNSSGLSTRRDSILRKKV